MENNKRIKLTIIFRTCVQTGVNHYSDGAYTRTLMLTEEQSKLFFNDKGNCNNEIIYDEVICEVSESE